MSTNLNQKHHQKQDSLSTQRLNMWWNDRIFFNIYCFQLYSKMPKESPKVSFYLRLHNGNGCLLNLPPTCTLQRALSILAEQKLTMPSAYRLIVNGRHVRDYSLTIKQLGISNGSIVHVEQARAQRIKPISKIDVTIFCQGDKIVIQAQYSDNILSIKQKIYELSGITPQEQLLIFKGRKLNNTQSLQHYKIQPDSLICLHLVNPSEPHSSIKQQGDPLLDSVVSLTRKASLSSRTTLFRSDSIGQRKYKDIEPFDVEFKSKRLNSDEHYIIQEEYQKNRGCQLKNSVTLNVFGNQFNPYDCAEVYSQSADSEVDFMALKPQKIEPLFQYEQI